MPKIYAGSFYWGGAEIKLYTDDSLPEGEIRLEPEPISSPLHPMIQISEITWRCWLRDLRNENRKRLGESHVE